MKISDVLRTVADQMDADGYLQPIMKPSEWRTGNPTVDFLSQMMGVHRMQPTPQRDANLAAADAAYQNAYWGGMFPVGTLSLADKAFLVRRQPQWQAKFGKDIWRDGIVSGGHLELNQASVEGDAWRNTYRDEEVNRGLFAMVESRLSS